MLLYWARLAPNKTSLRTLRSLRLNLCSLSLGAPLRSYLGHALRALREIFCFIAAWPGCGYLAPGFAVFWPRVRHWIEAYSETRTMAIAAMKAALIEETNADGRLGSGTAPAIPL